MNFDVVNLKPFACLAFPLSRLRENTVKQPDFGDELVTSFGLAAQRDDDASTALWIGLIRQRRLSRIEAKRQGATAARADDSL
ncbi:MAG: hypothetical protein ACLPND_05435, partial [Candidatus Korobacteraceae bacterium]